MVNRSKVLMIGWFSSSINYRHTDTMYLDLIKKLNSFVEMTVMIPRLNTKVQVCGIKVIRLSQHSLHYIEDVYDNDKNKRQRPQTNELESASGAQLFSLETQAFSNEEYREELFASTMKFAELVLKELDDTKYDIIHAQDWLSYPAAVVAKKHLDAPLIIQSHSLESEKDGNQGKDYINSIEKESLDFADMIVVPSRYGEKILVNTYNIKKDKIRVVPNGIKTIIQNDEKEDKSYLMVLILGRLLNQNSPEYIIDVAKRVIDFAPDVRFVIAGSSEYLSGIIDMVAHNRIGDRFFFTGPLDEVQMQELLRLTDVYVLPAVSEPFGSTVLEAIQHNIPCVVSKQSGVSEIVTHALKSDFWDTEKLATQIISLLKFKPLRHEMIKNSKQDIDEFDWYESAVKIRTIYKEIIH